MDTILIATDFSTAGRTATHYGFELARLMEAKVILLSVNEVSKATELVHPVTPGELERLSYKKLLVEAERYDASKTVALSTEVRFGDIVESIIQAATDSNASFIVTGMKQGAFELRKILGSTVTNLIKLSPVPVFVVPATFAFAAPKSIALACDLDEETDLSILNPMKKLAQAFKAQVYMVRVIKNIMDEPISTEGMTKKLVTWFGEVDTTFEYTRAENVAKALTHFVDRKGVNLVTVIPHEHSFFEKLFTRSVTRDLLFKSHVPLLILPGLLQPVHREDEQMKTETGSVINIQ